jgi:hypothetical protein
MKSYMFFAKYKVLNRPNRYSLKKLTMDNKTAPQKISNKENKYCSKFPEYCLFIPCFFANIAKY